MPGSERYPVGGHDKLPQYSYLKNSVDRGVWQIIDHRVPASDTTNEN